MDESPDLPALVPAVTFLREIALEGQELHTELRYAGFTEHQATQIVARMIVDAVNFRDEQDYTIVSISYEDDDDQDEDNDPYDDGDSDQ